MYRSDVSISTNIDEGGIPTIKNIDYWMRQI